MATDSPSAQSEASDSATNPSASSETAARPFPRRLLAALTLSSTLAPLNSTMLSVMLASVGPAFGVAETFATQALVTSYLITSIVMQAPSGKLGDRYGHRRAVAFGQLLFGVGSVGAMFAPSIWTLALARIVMAVGGALIVPSAGALLRLEIPPDKRGQAFGLFGASMALSAALGPVVGGVITSAFSWRATFGVNVVLLPIAALIAGRSPAPTEPARGPFRFDVVGTVLLGLALTLAVVASNLAGDPRRMPLLGAATAVAVLFVLFERRQSEPVVDLRLVTRPVFLAGGLVIALHNVSMYALLFELPSAVTRMGASGHAKGLLLGAMMISMVVVSPISGRLADKFGARKLALAGTALALAGMSAIRFVGLHSVPRLLPGLVLVGMGLGLAASPSQASAMSDAPRAESGMAAALLAMMRYLGGIAGLIVLSFVWSAPSDPARVLIEHDRAVMFFGAALGLAVVAAAFLPREAPGRLD